MVRTCILFCLATAFLPLSCVELPVAATEVQPSSDSPASVESAPPPVDRPTLVRASGTVQAVRYQVIQTPRISGKRSQLTLVTLVPNGAMVEEGAVLAEFDPTEQLEASRQAQAKYEDLGHQVEQKQAENEAEVAKRRLQVREAEAELEGARIELRKGPLLADIDRLQNEVKAAAASERVASLRKSSTDREQAEASALRVLELQRDRQRVALDRAESNLSKLMLRAPLSGMVVLEAIWRNGSRGPAQEGDQVYPGQSLLRIFDPSKMEVEAYIAEPDRGVLTPGREARVSLDAYPDLEFTAHLEAASPVAASAIGSPIKTFLARFRLDQTDPHLLPDLSAAVMIPVDEP